MSTGALVLADFTCDPFHLHFTVAGGCPALTDNGVANVYFDDPDGSTHCPCVG
jgi:hypothetical protein